MFILKQLRRKKNVSQTDLAEAIGVSLRTIQLYEKKNANIPIKNLTKIAGYFDLSIAELYMQEVNETAEPYEYQTISHWGNKVKRIGGSRYVVTVPLITEEDQQKYRPEHGRSYNPQLAQISFVVDQLDNGSYTAFEITNDSMDDGSIRGIPNKAIVLGMQVEKEKFLKTLSTLKYPFWILVYEKGIMCKEITAYDEASQNISCHSLNSSPEYSDFQIHLDQVGALFIVIKKQVS